MLGAVDVLDGLDDEAPSLATTKRAAMRKEFLGLVTDQAKRIVAIVDRYDRMGRVEPRKTLVRINEIAAGAARAHGLEGVARRLDASEPECDADRDLLESAVENVVRNAREAASENGGAVSIETASGDGLVVIRVIDTGPGMDARRAERAFDDFFTTKASGSGLGLAFVRRIMLAHDGDVSLVSERGVGTTVTLRLPAQPRPR